MKKTKPAKPPSEEFKRFGGLHAAILAVPKKEIDAEKAKYEKHKATKKRKVA